MLFNSLDFAIFLPVVFVLYWFVFQKNIRAQNVLLTISSYVFYGWWDWRFLFLILFSTLVDYSVAQGLDSSQDKKRRKLLLWISISVNLGLLGFFKYYNFFVDNFVTAFSLFGTKIQAETLNIILPVGISFYTFQTLSYTIDVYRRNLKPTKDIVAFSSYVCFFPQLVAGPIERATHLLPQFLAKRKFTYEKASDGMRQLLSGFFKKIVIADNCAQYANVIFNNSSEYSGSTLFLGAIFFTFQIYGDFSGYSDMAIGMSRLFGFELKSNFRFPYFSRDIAEFWRRWHISLSTWFRDYLYIPLGGSRGNTMDRIRNTFIIFLVSGFWHGANWTFIIWGLINAMYFLPLLLTQNNRRHLDVIAKGRMLPRFREFFSMSLTFMLTVLAWIFFRAEDLSHATTYLAEIFSNSLFTFPRFPKDDVVKPILLIMAFFVIIEWIGRDGEYTLSKVIAKWKRPFRWGYYLFMTFLIFYFMGEEQEFIYFQF